MIESKFEPRIHAINLSLLPLECLTKVDNRLCQKIVRNLKVALNVAKSENLKEMADFAEKAKKIVENVAESDDFVYWCDDYFISRILVAVSNKVDQENVDALNTRCITDIELLFDISGQKDFTQYWKTVVNYFTSTKETFERCLSAVKVCKGFVY